MTNIKLTNVKLLKTTQFYIDWFKNGKRHRKEKPAVIAKLGYSYWENNKFIKIYSNIPN